MTQVPPRLASVLEGRYRIEAAIGHGGMAHVYRARDLKHQRTVALKVLREEFAASVGAARFLAEIRTTASLQHPHILPLFDSGEADGFLFYVMPYIEGESLADRLAREKQLPVDDAVQIARAVASALDYAHRHGVIHRDIKPANVLLHDGQAVIADFGIALAVEAAGGDRLTATGLSVGTPAYMSPEQIAADSRIGPATDVYALGCVLYEMLAGEPPYTAATVEALVARIVVGNHLPISTLRKSVPSNVAAVVDRSLQAVPADRFPSAQDFAAALGDSRFGETRSEERPVARRRMVRMAALVLAAIAVVAALGWALWPTAPPAARSVAVLPFANTSGDAENGYFSDGLSEQIITALSHIDGLHVAARTSSFALRDGVLDVRAIGDTLGVEAVLEGSVRRQDSRIKVTAQLIDAASGYHIWSGEYDRQVSDVIAVQDEIARAIAGALELRLPPRGAATPAQRPPNLAAYDLYLRARHLRDDLSEDAMRSAMELLDRAIQLEPGFALAWAEKANVMGPAINFGHVPREQGVTEMRAAVERALALEPELGEAHVALGILQLFYEWDWAGGERALRRAVELNPNDPHAWHHLGNQLSVAGRFDEAMDARMRGIALDPLNARARSILAVELMKAGRHAEAVAEYERARQLDPMNPNVLGTGPAVPIGADIHLARGNAEGAVQELLRIAALRGATPGEMDAIRTAFTNDGMRGVWRSWLDMDLRQSGGTLPSLRLAASWAYIGDAEQALDWLERAYAARSSTLVFLRTQPAFAELRSHPRFVRIVTEMKLPGP